MLLSSILCLQLHFRRGRANTTRGEAALPPNTSAYRTKSQMKCTNCGLPLSPSRTYKHCPRCGMPIAAGPRPDLHPAHHYFESNREMGSGENVNYTPPPTPIMTQTPPAYPSLQAPPHTSRQVQQPQPTWAPHEPVAPHIPHTVQQSPHYASTGQAPLQSGQLGQTPSSRRNKTNLGFSLSGLCLLLGGLILLFVYYMSLGLPNSTTNTAGQHTGTSHVAQTTPNSTTPTPSPTLVMPTATPFPGQHYIDNAQMASSVNLATSKVIQPATTFKVNQKVYVSFQLHTGGQTGAVCLLWYLNGTKLFPGYPLTARSNESAAYTFAVYGSTGSAYVQLYWASSAKCTDEILAQQVSFTVTN